MSDRVFVGPNVSDLNIGQKPSRISRVNILVDSEHQYTAGDDTGRTLEKTVPWGSQAMADAILSAVKDYDYQPFTGTDALIDPAAEIGDGVTVGGTYSVLAQKDISFGRLTTTDISAPGTDEIDDEYPYISRAQRQENRKQAETRSLITKSSTEIKEMVENEVSGLSSSITVQLESITGQVNGLDGRVSIVEQTAEGISATVTGLDGKVTEVDARIDSLKLSVSNGSTSSTITLTGDGIEAQSQNITFSGFVTFGGLSSGTTTIDGACIKTGEIAAEHLNLTGAISWDDLDGTEPSYWSSGTGLKGKIQQAQNDATSASQTASGAASTASSALSTANSAWSAASTAQTTINQWAYSYGGRTYIDGNQLMTGTVTATTLQGGTVDLLATNGFSVGGIDIVWTDTSDYGLSFHTETSRGGIRLLAAGNVFLSAHNGDVSILMGTPDIFVSASVLPNLDGQLWLGSSKYKWGAVYASSGTVQTSDRELKHDIEPMPEKYTDMIDRLASVRYKYNDGTSNRYHTGFIAQDVKAVMDEVGIDSTEFGGYVADVDGEGKPIYMLRYEEFIGILWNRVRELTNRINALEAHNG